ncbi:hypothetical protein [Roseovarius aquimarinus]|uniref:BON domain-containing protein n=1 Tax=Roseovarius aquimarinus TaxID=1229156 RepID=A0ABW7IB79_9RHOB
MMKTVLTLALAASLAAPAGAACIAEYKAKRDDPLELFYGTAQIDGPCTLEDAEAELRGALDREGLTLLKVLSVRGS